jgi:spermidine synthase
MLGFAGGGIVAPLRAMGYDAPVRAVDLSRDGEALFRELSAAWCGRVDLAHADAVSWLRAARGRWDGVLEDLSVPSPAGTVKPYDSFDALPELIRARLAPGGVAVTNLLPLPGTSWDALTARVVHGHRRALVVHLDEYENRIVLCGPVLPDAAAASRALREQLRGIGSDQATRLKVRTLRR